MSKVSELPIYHSRRGSPLLNRPCTFLDVYAVPLTVIGTLLLCTGMALCAHLIESKTGERIYQRVCQGEDPQGYQQTKPKRSLSRMYWVQPGNQTVGDQIFDSFGYSDENSPLQRYVTSWKITGDCSSLCGIWPAVMATSLGFICQFMGLRAGHSSVAVMQLGVTLIMSLVRASLRAQRLEEKDNFMAKDPDLFQGHELDYLALKVLQSSLSIKPKTGSDDPDDSSNADPEVQSRLLWKVFRTIEQDHGSSAAKPPIANPQQRGEPTELHRLSVPSGSPPILAGFQIIPSVPNSREEKGAKQLRLDAEKALAQWISTEYCGQCSALCDRGCKKDPQLAVKAFLYRSRLARMTTLEQPESESSKNWGNFVTVRSTALVLAEAIEDTMQILFDLESSSPVTLCDSWERAFAIFWTVQCCLQDPVAGTIHDSDIKMALRRSTGDKGTPEGPWKADRSELEAVLSMWTWSSSEASKLVDQPVSRIISVSENLDGILSDKFDLDVWRQKGGVKMQPRVLLANRINFDPSGVAQLVQHQNAVWWKDGASYDTQNKGPPIDSNDQRWFLGWHNVKLAKQNRDLQVLSTHSTSSFLLNCAQEIYSVFFTAILQAVKDIGECSVTVRQQETPTAVNDNVDRMWRSLVGRGLCNTEEAFSCTMPLLRNQGILQLPQELINTAGALAEKHLQNKQWLKMRDLVNWRLAHSYAKINLRPDLHDSRTKMEAVNNLRLAIIESCETYHRALLHGYKDADYFSVQGIIDLLEPRLHPWIENTNTIPLVWLDPTSGPGLVDNEKTERSLADTIKAYGQAALWNLQTRNLLTVDISHLQDLLGRTRDRETPPYDWKAMDLDSALHLTVGRFSEGLDVDPIFRMAVESGWYMVARSSILLGVSVESYSYFVNYSREQLSSGLHWQATCLAYASHAGDINTVRMLLENGAGVWDGRRLLSACHCAAVKGHAVVMEELLKQDQCSEVLGDEISWNGMTPLNYTIKWGNPTTARVLLGQIRPNQVNHYLITKPSLHYAIVEGKEDMIEPLLECAAVDPNWRARAFISSPPLTCAVKFKQKAIFDRLLNDGRVDANVPDSRGRTALWWASALGLEACVQKLVDSRKMSRFDEGDDCGTTPHMVAVEAGHLGIFHKLNQAAESPVDLRSILVAAKNSHVEVVKELLPGSVKDKMFAKKLLEFYDLGQLWPLIQDSPLWEGGGKEGLEDNAKLWKEMMERFSAEDLELCAENLNELVEIEKF